MLLRETQSTVCSNYVFWSCDCFWIGMVHFGLFCLKCGTAQKEICFLVNEVERNWLSGWISLHW